MKMETGEELGDFFNRLKNEYAEAEMEKATPWSLFICKLISTFSDNQDPGRMSCQNFRL